MTQQEVYKILKESPGEYFTPGEIAIKLNKSFCSVMKTIYRTTFLRYTEKIYYKDGCLFVKLREGF